MPNYSNNPETEPTRDINRDAFFEKDKGFFAAHPDKPFMPNQYELELGDLGEETYLNELPGQVADAPPDEPVPDSERNRLSGFFSQEIEREAIDAIGLRDFADRLRKYGIKETDRQFSIASHMNFDPYFKDTHDREAIDVVNPATKERVYFTKPSDEEAESALLQAVGSMATLPRVGEVGPYSVFSIARGSRSLLRTFTSAPYEREYMQRLAAKSWQFTALLLHLDAPALADDYVGFALTHNGESDDGDDVHITLKPPLKPLSEGIDAKLLQRRTKEFRKNPANSLPAYIKKLGEYALEDPEMAADDMTLRFFLPEHKKRTQ